MTSNDGKLGAIAVNVKVVGYAGRLLRDSGEASPIFSQAIANFE